MMSTSPVHESRICRLKTGIEPESPTHVLYWMSTALRTQQNPSLEYAAFLSNRFELPLRTIHILESTAADGDALPERHALFQLQSLQDVSCAFRQRRIPFTVHHALDGSLDVLKKLSDGAAAVVTDADYLRRGRALRRDLAAALAVPFYVVEANVIVPVAEASEKAEHAARTIRPKITRAIPRYLVETPIVQLNYQPESVSEEDGSEHGIRTVTVTTDEDIEDVLVNWEGIDREATPVRKFKGGEIAAQKTLDEFVKSRLSNYNNGRNEPALQLQSDLSPYLRAGNISPITIAMKAKEASEGKSNMRESRDAFLEELIVRRELAANACWFREQYDSYEDIVPNFAQVSLALHTPDKRGHIYTYEELEAGVTHDPYWNAAQLEMVARGKMHGYMRMYWAKQVIGWVEHPADAFLYTLRLNNRWELDAVDPNSYVGVAWCFGLHDQGWRERPIWGKVRYMNDAGLKRKFNMAAYVSMVDTLIAKEGLPKHISKLRKERNKHAGQSTLTQTAGKKRAPAKKRQSAAKREPQIESDRKPKRSKQS